MDHQQRALVLNPETEGQPPQSLPREIAWALGDRPIGASGMPGWKAETALMVALSEGLADSLELFAEDFERALAPVSPQWLADRLSDLQMAFGHITDPHKMTAWLHETGRLLEDLPQDLLSAAIDEAVKRQERGFVPSVGEIRKIADPLVAERRQIAERLRHVIVLRDRPKAAAALPTNETRRCTPQEAAEIINQVCPFVRESEEPKLIRHEGPARKPTRADYIALGVAPDVIDRMAAEGQL